METIAIRQFEIRNSWREIWFAISEGNVDKYIEIKSLETLEFFDYYDNWKAKIDAQINALKAKK